MKFIASATTHFYLPDTFDVAAYDEVDRFARSVINPNNPEREDAWVGYAAAWVGLAVRLRAATEYDASFAKSVVVSGRGFDGRYEEERDLYGCMSSALSAVECAYMAVYCVSSVLAPAHFPLTSDRHLIRRPKQVAKALSDSVPGDRFAIFLEVLAESTELESLAALRNTLAHRGAIPRRPRIENAVIQPSGFPTNPKALASKQVFSLEVGPGTTNEPARWAISTCSLLSREFATYLRSKTTG